MWSLKTAGYNRKNMEAICLLHFFEHYYMFDKYAKKLRPTLLGSKVVPGSARALALGALPAFPVRPPRHTTLPERYVHDPAVFWF